MKSLSLTLAHVDKMAYGSRSATDFSLIGEKTGTAGVTTPTIAQSPTGATSREQAKFLNLGDAAGVADTDGITAFDERDKLDSECSVLERKRSWRRSCRSS